MTLTKLVKYIWSHCHETKKYYIKYIPYQKYIEQHLEFPSIFISS